MDRSDRVRIEVKGPDRAKFLHNLTTNEVKRLAVGQGVEAFVTSPQGKTIGHLTLLATEDAILARTDPGGAEGVLPHFQKYGLFDDVEVNDVSSSLFELHLFGPAVEEVLGRIGAEMPGSGELSHLATNIAGVRVRIIRESPLGAPALTLIGDLVDAEGVREVIRTEAGSAWTEMELDSAEAMRIEAGTPVFGRDVTAENLPQEVARDDRAINFVKGCYLGQETVARIDALGHVNKLLRLLRITGGIDDVPPVGSAIEADGKVVGVVTSSAFSSERGSPVALGYVKLAKSTAGSAVEIQQVGRRVAAVVSDLPRPGEASAQ